jgi:hypothetical protein
MSNLQVTREKLPTGTAEPQISGFFSKLLAVATSRDPDVLGKSMLPMYA